MHIARAAEQIANRKAFLIVLCKRIKSDANYLFFVIFRKDLLPRNRRHHSSNTLLSIDQNFFAHSAATIFEFNIRVLPNDQVSCRIAIVK